MKVIIEHDDGCPESARGKQTWINAFVNMQREAQQKYDQVSSMRTHCERWAELARVCGCNCGAAEEIKRRASLVRGEAVPIEQPAT
jgi:hypothetical protein